MIKFHSERTITAISTPPGEGGIAVIRITGKDSIKALNRVFHPVKKGVGFEHCKAVFGNIIEDGKLVDQGYAIFFKSPDSYTGEDTIELSCHGGRYVTGKVLSMILDAGAYPAEPGEFTRRAYLNNKIDLVQAESVAALIHADTERAYSLAQNQLSGFLSSHFMALKNELQDILTLLEANIDFSEEDIQALNRNSISERLIKLIGLINEMINSYEHGRLIQEGIRVALIGPPNAGKSSLFNALCEKERVIVDEHPGTTRDLVEETISIAGERVTLIDTAGIRKSSNRVEVKGIDLAKKCAKDSDLVIIIFDASEKTPTKVVNAFKSLQCRNKIFVLNKSDLKQNQILGKEPSIIQASAKTGLGIENIKKAILKASGVNAGNGEGPVITSERQKSSLKKAQGSLVRAIKLIKSGTGEELLAIEIRNALDSLASITGEVSDDDILNGIFSRFCIGK